MSDSRGAHPYSNLAGSPAWQIIDRAVAELAGNRDLVETTAHDYIVGYLCNALSSSTGDANGPPSDKEARRAALQKLRAAIQQANPDRRDLVSELIAERRAEAQRD